MPASSGESSPFAEFWTVNAIDAEQQRLFADRIDTDNWYGLAALGVLAAGQAYFAAHQDTPEITLVQNHDELMWSTATKQLCNALSSAGYNTRLYSIDDIAQSGRYALIDGPLPSPQTLLARPGLDYLRRTLTYLHGKGSRPHGFDYIGLTQRFIATGFRLGFADPIAGTRSEMEISPGHLKARHGFPPPPIKFPVNKSMPGL